VITIRTCLLIFSFFILTCASRAQSTNFQKDRVVIAAYGDYLDENLHWSIAGNSSGQNPNVLSEVSWKNLKMRGIGLDVQVNIWSGIFIKGNYHRADIYDGNATDTDYALDNRTNPTYRAVLNSNEGYVYDYSAALAYRFIFPNRLSVSLYAGYHKSRQSLFLKDADNGTDEGELKLNSTYLTSWTGPMIGCETMIGLKKWLSLKATFNYAQTNYHAFADWNLIDAFAHPVSFEHNADGYETTVALQLNFQVIPAFSIFARGNYTGAATGTGTDQLFLVDGRSVTSQLNEAVRNSRGAGLGICYKFY
jgi:hypothetical protein